MTRRCYVLAGPADCGSRLGYWQEGRVPAGAWAVVADGEYANGGHGPSSVDGRLYRDLSAAEAACRVSNDWIEEDADVQAP